MKESTFTFTDHAGVTLFVYKWTPDTEKPKAIVQIVHGLGEHAARYAHVAQDLTNAGYSVYADDHRGHGKTAGSLEMRGNIKPDGWEGCIKDLKQLTDIIRKENPGVPVFLLGHSWGSFMTQDYIQRWGSELKGVILSGTAGKQGLLGGLIIIAKRIIKKEGEDGISPMMAKLSLDPMNKPFAPNRTTHDWLSRDDAVVDKYKADPFCGFDLPNYFWLQFALGLKKIWDKKNEALIPKDLPTYLFCGSMDPVSQLTKTFKILVERYKKLGIKDIESKIYEGARHETLNEINKEEVKSDLISWLNRHL
jgi:alpha-beta hydrolase superfamily lysophospholipase